MQYQCPTKTDAKFEPRSSCVVNPHGSYTGKKEAKKHKENN
jgi:hypothetical protein